MSILQKQRGNQYLRAFLANGLLAVLVFLPFIIVGKGLFWYMGDYNAQQIPFYVHCHEMIRNGAGMWDFSTELGNNLFSSYTYYTLCSPFFWLMIPFPTSWVPYLMGPMYILKFACAGLTSFAYIRYFTKTEKAALWGSILYVFSGWSVFNIFYNQFHESYIIFPLLLLSLEKLVNENKKGIFAVVVALSAITNYYFFVGMAVFTVIYWAVKTITKAWEMNLEKFLRILAEAVFGTLAATFVLLPSFITVFSMSRTSSHMNGWSLWFYPDSRTYFCIIQSMLFPAEIPALQSFCDVNGIAWQSCSLYLPLVGVIGVLTYIRNNKKDWKSKLLIISFIMAMIPGLNALFTALQNVYYARWFMMPILIMTMVTAVSLEDFEAKEFISSFKMVSVITIFIILMEILTPSLTDGKWRIGIWNSKESRIYLFVFFCLIAVAQLLLIFSDGLKEKYLTDNKKIFRNLILVILIVCYTTLCIGRSTSGRGAETKESLTFDKVTVNMDLDDNSRISVFSSKWNLPNIRGINCTDFFHSIAPEGTVKAYKTLLNFDREVISPIDIDNPYFKTITSVKYFVSDKRYTKKYTTEMSGDKNYAESFDKLKAKYGDALMPCYTEIKNESKNYKTYVNDCYLPMGIYYDYYIKESDYKKLNKEQQGRAMINALVISDDKEKDIEKTLKNYDEIAVQSDFYTDGEYLSDCREKASCVDYKELCNGFTATSVTNRKIYVMFSVSTDHDGWKAYVNGKETEIKTVDGGFMAVEVDAGTNNIEFKYSVPGLKTGLMVSGVGIIGIVVLFFVPKKKRER